MEFVEDDNVVLTENICALARTAMTDFTFRSTELAERLRRKLVGEYVEHDVNHGKTIYKRTASAWLVLPTGSGTINS